MTQFTAYAAPEAGAPLQTISFDPGPISDDQVEIEVMACGLCHSDLSMIDNSWGISRYPLVAGHEVVGKIVAKGDQVKHLEIGQTVGSGWLAGSCQTCAPCLGGTQHHCSSLRPTIIGRHGGFADRVRMQALWAIPLPDGVDAKKAGPLFCGGITAFSPFIDYSVLPTDRVGIVGIGGLGHLAIKFARAWGCEVTAFTSSMDKEAELKEMGAHYVVNSRDDHAVKALRGRFNLVLSTVNVNLAWHRYLAALAPKGKLVHVGMVGEPMSIRASSLVTGQKAVGGSDTGSPGTMAKMLEFCARHQIEPQVEYFKMSEINDAIAHLKSGKARYRVVLTND